VGSAQGPGVIEHEIAKVPAAISVECVDWAGGFALRLFPARTQEN